MVKLDTVKCGISETCIHTFDKRKLNNNGYVTKRPGNGGTEIKVKDGLPLGLHEIKIELYKGDVKNVVLEFSAKILKSDYKNMISQNTIDQVQSNINQNSYIQLKPYSLMQAIAYRVDIVNDLFIDEPEKGIQAISLIHNNKKYSLWIYGKNESVLFRRIAKTVKESLTFYRKDLELRKAKNKNLVSMLNKDDCDYFSNIIRVEQKMYGNKKIKSAFNITDNILEGVLSSESKPNYRLYQKIKGGMGLMSKIQKAESVDDIKWMSIIILCDYDINKIEGILKPFAGKNLSWYRKKYKPILEKLISKNINESGFTEILQNIENQLSA